MTSRPNAANAKVRTLILAVVLRELHAWVVAAAGATPTWRGTRHERRWSITAGVISVHDDDGMHIKDRERG